MTFKHKLKIYNTEFELTKGTAEHKQFFINLKW